MSFIDLFTGTKKPVAGTPILNINDVKANLLKINRPTAPFIIQPSNEENADLVAEWKIVDAQWYQIFAKAGLSKVFKVLIALDDTKKEVRTIDKEFTVSWTAGIPTLSAAISSFRGQKTSISFGTAVGFTEQLRPGVIYNYKFVTSEIKNPIIKAILDSGWTYKPVSFGSLR